VLQLCRAAYPALRQAPNIGPLPTLKRTRTRFPSISRSIASITIMRLDGVSTFFPSEHSLLEDLPLRFTADTEAPQRDLTILNLPAIFSDEEQEPSPGSMALSAYITRYPVSCPTKFRTS